MRRRRRQEALSGRERKLRQIEIYPTLVNIDLRTTCVERKSRGDSDGNALTSDSRDRGPSPGSCSIDNGALVTDQATVLAGYSQKWKS